MADDRSTWGRRVAALWPGVARSKGSSGPGGRWLMLPRPDQQAHYFRLAERLAGLQTVKAFDQHEAIAVGAQQDRRELSDLQHALGDLLDLRRIESGPEPDGRVNIGDHEGAVLHHSGESSQIGRASCRERVCQYV